MPLPLPATTAVGCCCYRRWRPRRRPHPRCCSGLLSLCVLIVAAVSPWSLLPVESVQLLHHFRVASRSRQRQQHNNAGHDDSQLSPPPVVVIPGSVAGTGIYPQQLAPNVSVMPPLDSGFFGGGDGFDLPSLFRNEDADLIQRIRQRGPKKAVPAQPPARDFAPPLPPLHVAADDGTKFGYDDVAPRKHADWGDFCFSLDSCQRCSSHAQCGWCAVEATCYTRLGVGQQMCGGGWTTKGFDGQADVGECPPEASAAVRLPAMELDTDPSHVPFVLDDNLDLDGCERVGFRLPGDCQKVKLRRAGGVPISAPKVLPDSADGSGVGDDDGNNYNNMINTNVNGGGGNKGQQHHHPSSWWSQKRAAVQRVRREIAEAHRNETHMTASAAGKRGQGAKYTGKQRGGSKRAGTGAGAPSVCRGVGGAEPGWSCT